MFPEHILGKLLKEDVHDIQEENPKRNVKLQETWIKMERGRKAQRKR